MRPSGFNAMQYGQLRWFLRAALVSVLFAFLQISVFAQGAKGLFYRQLENPASVSNIGLTYSIELIRDGKTALVDSRFPFVSGDQLRFHVQSNIDGFLYILLQHGSRGDSAMLFPAGGEKNQVAAGKDILVPENGVLEFDNVTGTETVKLVLSAEKVLAEPASRERSIIIKPKHAVDSLASASLIEFALKEDQSAVMKSTDNPRRFVDEPAVTIVAADARKTLSVEMDLCHGSGQVQGGGPGELTAGGSTVAASTATPVASLPFVEKLSGAAGVAKNSAGDTSTAISSDIGVRSMASNTAVSTALHSALNHAGNLPAGAVADKWAVIIGISQFKNPRWNLLYPAKDAEDLSRFLIDEGHFARDHVKVLTNEAATRENILTTLGGSWLPHNAGPDDIVFVYFASHGTSAELDAARKSFLVAYDTDPVNAFATGIELQDLARTIKRRLNSSRLIIVLDACHAGAAEPGAKSLAIQSFSLEDLLQGSGQMVIASAGENQIAHDSMRYKNGIFTKHFIDGLRENKKLSDAFAYTRLKVEDECKKDFHQVQSPVLKDTEWKGSDVVLSVPPAQPSRAQE